MPEYTYSSRPNPFVGSIADAMLRRGDIAAARAAAIADAESRAAIASGDAWGHASERLGGIAGGVATALTDPRRQAQQLDLQRAQELHAGEQQLDTLVKPVTPSGPAEGGGNLPTEHPFLDDQGLYDIPKLTQALSAAGHAHLAPELLKGAELTNDAILKHQALQQKTDEAKAIVNGDMAHGVVTLMDKGVPFDKAFDLTASPGFAATGATPQQYVQLKQQLAALPPDQQRAALTRLMDQAARLGGGKTLGKDAQEIDRYGRVVAANVVPEKPTEASLAADAATLGTDHETKTAKDSAAAIAKLKPPPPRSESEQAMDAYARSIGKTRSEDLTDPERQAYIKRDAEQKAAAAFAQHKQERNYDVANPVPVKGKSQDELEQEARGVLQREFSSRSGGLGQEDGKVDQAIHLLALMDQYEGKNMPAQIHAELALGLARLTSPNGQVGIELEKEFRQKTAQEGIAKGIAYLTGDPQLVNATPEKLREMLRDSISRQGSVAQQNRQTYLDAMLSMLPTTLEPSRRDAIAQGTKLNRMPAPAGAPAGGTTRNGATWKDGPKGWGWYR